MKYKIGDKIRLKNYPEFGIGIIRTFHNGEIGTEFENYIGDDYGWGVSGKPGYCFNFSASDILEEPKKFNIGDKVKVVLQPGFERLSVNADSSYINKMGIITELPGESEYKEFIDCYKVEFSKQLGDSNYIVPEELELVENKSSNPENSKSEKKEIKSVSRTIKMGKTDSIKITTESGVFLAELYFYDGKLSIQTRLSKRVKKSIK
jgi:ribosomal protein L21E